MGKVDQFESTFRSAIKEVYTHVRIEFSSVLVVTDLSKSEALEFSNSIKTFATVIGIDSRVNWDVLYAEDFTTTQDLLNCVSSSEPDLIFSYRNLHSKAWNYPHSLGEHLDVLVQKTDSPIVILPNPRSGFAHKDTLINTDVVMAMTDHLLADDRLVNYAARLVEDNGTLWLVHIEDTDIFNKYMSVISKIIEIDTDEATEKIRHRLLKEPGDYIDKVSQVLREKKPGIQLKSIVSFGHSLSEFCKYIDEHKVDLLVMNSRDDQQMAMHGLAYPLAVELRQTPLLLL